MLITDIAELDKKRSKVYVDGVFLFVLYKGELGEYGIKVGKELGEDAYSEITEKVLPKRCKLRAMNLLQKRDYTEKQLRDKLAEGLYAQEIIDEAIAYVKSYHYLDDERFARDYITYHIPTRSKNRIIQDLVGKGISKEMIMPLLEELYSEEEGKVELEQINRLLDKKHFDPENADFKEKQKVMAFLMRRGYQMSDITKAMDRR
ncbi:MAG: regulatory protein RecX [Butyrivibrio sp.]|nr:regulatory protein RecX [Butyrivibrio sp.]